MRCFRFITLATLSLLPSRVQAGADWLAVEGSCHATVEQLAERIEAELAGVRPAALSLVIDLVATTPVRGRLRVLSNTRLVGEKQVEARSCDEALSLLSAIAALALSSFPAAERDDRVAGEERAPPALRAVVEERPAVVRDARHVRRDGDALVRSSAAQRWRVLATAGVSLGAGTPTTLLVAGGVAATVARGELRLVARYGAPSTTEEVEASPRSLRHDFGSTALDYCLALDRARWCSLCGGWEMLVRRVRRVERAMTGLAEHTRRHLLFGPTMGLAFVLRQLRAQPQLELSGLVPVWGASPGFGFRAAVGGGLPF